MIDLNIIYNEDCLETIQKITDKTVDLVLTSPPYKTGKLYDESIDLDNFINKISIKLKDNGIFAFQTGNRVKNGIIEPIDIITYNTFKMCGYSMINRIIWSFQHGLHCKNRFSGRYETINLYSKTKNYTFNLDNVRIPQKYPNKKYYKGPKKGQLSCNPLGKNPGDVWDIVNIKNNHIEKTKHPCQFPELLCKRIILTFTNKGDLVYDPFMGSGTTAKVCKDLGRNYIGSEISKEYCDIIKERLK